MKRNRKYKRKLKPFFFGYIELFHQNGETEGNMKNFLMLIFFGVTKSPKIWLVNPETGERKGMSFGFNLQILLVGGFFGLPLFFLRLWNWAWGLFLLSSVQFYYSYLHIQQVLSATTVAEYEAALQRTSDPIEKAVGALLVIGVAVLSVKGNQWATEHLLKKGWRFENLSDPLVEKAVKKWKISKHYRRPPVKKEKL